MNMMLAGTEKSFPLSLPPHFPTIGSIWLLCLRLPTKLCMLSTMVKTIHYTNMCMPSTNLYCQPTGEPMPLVFLLCTLPPVDIVQFFDLMQEYQWTLFSTMCFSPWSQATVSTGDSSLSFLSWIWPAKNHTSTMVWYLITSGSCKPLRQRQDND